MSKQYFKKASSLHGERHQLVCCLCGEEDRDKLIVEDLGLAAGIQGEDYSFCDKCWKGRGLGKRILALVGYPAGMKLLDSSVEEVES